MGVDVAALNVLVAGLAQSGRMQAAEEAAWSACAAARAARLPPPIEAYGAVVDGCVVVAIISTEVRWLVGNVRDLCRYARMNAVEPAVKVLREFYKLGGKPDKRMLHTIVELCVRNGSLKRAAQVRAAPLTLWVHGKCNGEAT